MAQVSLPPAKPLPPFLAGPDAPAEEDLYKCVHCGLCLSSCPTYLETGLETESPRGRIALMRAVAEGRTTITPAVTQHWELCLQCRACEAVCPSGVPYGRLMERTRAQLVRTRPPSLGGRVLRRLVLAELLPHLGRLRLLGRLLWLYQRSGFQWAVRASHVLHLAPALASQETMLPTLPRRFFSARGQVYPAIGVKQARIGLLSGCVMPLVHAGVMEACVRVLQRNGCEVVVPAGQVCCGALNLHSGEREHARRMALHNAEVFLEAGVDAVVVASAGCGAAMKECPDLFEVDSGARERAKEFSARVRDIHEFLAALPLVPPTASLPLRVTYQDPCHLAHAQRVTAAPRKLLRAIPGLELVEMADSTRCCGAAGSYQLLQREMSQRLLASKMRAALATGAQVIATANPGCVLQLQQGVRQAGSAARVAYVVELLDEAYRKEAPEA